MPYLFSLVLRRLFQRRKASVSLPAYVLRRPGGRGGADVHVPVRHREAEDAERDPSERASSLHDDSGRRQLVAIERQTLKIIVREEGFRKMWKGITMNWIKGPISMGISFACYEVIERLFGVTKLQNSSVC